MHHGGISFEHVLLNDNTQFSSCQWWFEPLISCNNDVSFVIRNLGTANCSHQSFLHYIFNQRSWVWWVSGTIFNSDSAEAGCNTSVMNVISIVCRNHFSISGALVAIWGERDGSISAVVFVIMSLFRPDSPHPAVAVRWWCWTPLFPV